MYIKLLGALAIGLIVWAGYAFVTNLVEENNELKVSLENARIAIEKKDLELADMRLQQAANRANAEKLQAAIQEERVKVDHVRKLFADERFEKLIQKKPGLMTIKMQEATQKVFSEVEAAANE